MEGERVSGTNKLCLGYTCPRLGGRNSGGAKRTERIGRICIKKSICCIYIHTKVPTLHSLFSSIENLFFGK